MEDHKPNVTEMKNVLILPVESCGYKTELDEEIAKSMKVLHSSERPFQCDQCDYSTKTRNYLLKHQVRHLSNQDKVKFLRKCPVENCGYQTILGTNLQNHMITHSIKRPFKCDKCDYSAKRRSALQTHRVHKHSSNNFKEQFMKKCPFQNCNYQSLFGTNLPNHLKSHSIQSQFKREKFDYSQSAKQTIQTNGPKVQHKFKHTTKISTEKKISRQCPFKNCNYQTIRKINMKNHLITHSTERPFKCDQCDYSAKRRETLYHHRAHKHLNNEDKQKFMKKCPFENCDYQSIFGSNLPLHLRSHSMECPFKCDKCEYSSKNPTSLKLHYETKHSTETVAENKILIKCQIENCQFVTLQRRNLYRHLKSHNQASKVHREKTLQIPSMNLDQKTLYSCKNCNFRSEKNDIMALHNEKAHSLPIVVLRFLPIPICKQENSDY